MEAATADYQASQEDFNNVLIMIRAEVARYISAVGYAIAL